MAAHLSKTACFVQRANDRTVRTRLAGAKDECSILSGLYNSAAADRLDELAEAT